MACCAIPSCEAGRFFSWFARRSGRHYRKKGLGKTQKQIVEGVTAAGVADASLLEIGCGVGYLHQSLLKAGAARAIGVDMSGKMLAEASVLAKEQGLADRTAYRLGDFVDIGEGLDDADVTILDKVVCCYPDPESLLNRSLDKTRRALALTYPRSHFPNRLWAVLLAFLLRLLRVNFRSYVHDPAQIEAWITARGLRKGYHRQTLFWLTEVYVR